MHFMDTLNTYLTDKEGIIQTITGTITSAFNTTSLEKERESSVMRIEGLSALMTKEIEDNKRNTQNQGSYKSGSPGLRPNIEK